MNIRDALKETGKAKRYSETVYAHIMNDILMWHHVSLSGRDYPVVFRVILETDWHPWHPKKEKCEACKRVGDCKCTTSDICWLLKQACTCKEATP